MSVLIKGMEMPSSCNDCLFGHWSNLYQAVFCELLNFKDYPADYTGYKAKRLDKCPLVDVPTPHGRLVDVDAFKADYGMKDDCADCEKEIHGKVKSCEYDRTYSKMDFCSWIGDADVVIEAEEKDED